jgi:hypothetical protein
MIPSGGGHPHHIYYLYHSRVRVRHLPLPWHWHEWCRQILSIVFFGLAQGHVNGLCSQRLRLRLLCLVSSELFAATLYYHWMLVLLLLLLLLLMQPHHGSLSQ